MSETVGAGAPESNTEGSPDPVKLGVDGPGETIRLTICNRKRRPRNKGLPKRPKGGKLPRGGASGVDPADDVGMHGTGGVDVKPPGDKRRGLRIWDSHTVVGHLRDFITDAK